MPLSNEDLRFGHGVVCNEFIFISSSPELMNFRVFSVSSCLSVRGSPLFGKVSGFDSFTADFDEVLLKNFSHFSDYFCFFVSKRKKKEKIKKEVSISHLVLKNDCHHLGKFIFFHHFS